MENDVESPADHKLCGYICSVLTVPPDASIPLNSICRLAGESPNAYFVAQNDAHLTPIGETESLHSKLTPSGRRWSRFGMVHGSISVVHQLHALVAHRCLTIVARIVNISQRECDGDGGSSEFRAVVLVDVYLPTALWSGWQFPRSSSTAAALFRHLRCLFFFVLFEYCFLFSGSCIVVMVKFIFFICCGSGFLL